MERSAGWLERQGWEEAVRSREVRRRDPAFPIVVMERPGGRLYVAAVPDPRGDGGVVVAAGEYEREGAR
jgi:hypothetical protein